MNYRFHPLALLLLPSLFSQLRAADAPSAPPPVTQITVEVGHPGHAVSPTLHGVFFEDINYGADGGLYPELVQNRSFEHKDALYAWSPLAVAGAAGNLALGSVAPLNENNPHYLRLTITNPGANGFGVVNTGWGLGTPPANTPTSPAGTGDMAVKQGEKYTFSVRARASAPYGGNLVAELQGDTGQVLGSCRLGGLTADWQLLKGEITPSATTDHARLAVRATAAGTVDLDMVSLLPNTTFKNHGLRADLVQMLADLHPAFMRFPGGCIVEGKDLANSYRWKETVGDVSERKENWNRWMVTIKNALAPEYYQTYGLGFYEYFQLCEDIGAEPLPILNCGMSCQFQDAQLVPLDQLGPYVQDALDLVEFANGPVTSKWGALRAKLGHPAPFNVKMLGIGNEQWGEDYFPRYMAFYTALKAKYPDLKLVTGAGPGVDAGDKARYDLAWSKFKNGTPADIVDEHYYRPPQWFLDHAPMYDNQNRSGPHIFSGEFAVHDGTAKRNNLRAAIAEAAFMTGLVRNSDIVDMASYAPLFAKAGSTQWTPDLIWFDNSHAYGSPSYYVQAMFAKNRPDVILPVTMDQAKPDLFAVAGLDKKTGEIIVDVVNPTTQPIATKLQLNIGTWDTMIATAKATVLTSASPNDENTFDNPTKVAPVEETVALASPSLARTFPPASLTIFRFKTQTTLIRF